MDPELVLQKRKKLRSWHCLVTILASIAVFVTTYALIIPAITWEKTLICELDEHVHSKSCYDSEGSLICGRVEHTHTAACFDAPKAAKKIYICGKSEHVHTEDCYYADGTLCCALEEHVHDVSCRGIQTIRSNMADNGAIAVITGKIPEGAIAHIEQIELSKEQVNGYLGYDKAVAIMERVAYDIRINLDGEEWQPDETVTVQVINPGIRIPDDDNYGVAHIDGNTDIATDVAATAVKGEKDGGLKFEADGFSVYVFYTYTVDFHYEGTEFSIVGESEIKLSELFKALYIDKSAADAVNVSFSDTTLVDISATDDGKDWILKSLEPFNTEETLTVVFSDGYGLMIDVTDAAVDETAKWIKITKANEIVPGGFYVIISANGTPKYLLNSSSTQNNSVPGTQVAVTQNTDGTYALGNVTEEQLWNIGASGNAYTFYNKATNKYIRPANGSFLNTNSATPAINLSNGIMTLNISGYGGSYGNYYLYCYNGTFSSSNSTSNTSRRNMELYRLENEFVIESDGVMEIWQKDGKFYSHQSCADPFEIKKVYYKTNEQSDTVVELTEKYSTGFDGFKNIGKIEGNTATIEEFVWAVNSNKPSYSINSTDGITSVIIHMVSNYNAVPSGSSVETFGYSAVPVTIIRDERYAETTGNPDAPMITVNGTASSSTLSVMDNVTIDNYVAAGNKTAVAVKVIGANGMIKLEGTVANSKAKTADGNGGIGIRLDQRGASEYWYECCVENQYMGVYATSGSVRLNTMHANAGPYDVQRNTVPICLSVWTDNTGALKKATLQKFAIDYNQSNSSVLSAYADGLTPLYDDPIEVVLEYPQFYEAGDVLMKGGSINESDLNVDLNGDGDKEDSVECDVKDSDRGAFNLVNFNGMTQAYKIMFDDTGTEPQFPVLKLATDLVFNERTGKWYPNLGAAVSDTAVLTDGLLAGTGAHGIEDGDTLVLFGNTSEKGKVVINNNITIRSAKTGTTGSNNIDDSVTAENAGHTIWSDGYLAGWAVLNSGETACLEIASGKTVEIGGSASGKLTLDGSGLGTVVSTKGTVSLNENVTVTNGNGTNGGGIYVGSTGTATVNGAAVTGNNAGNGGAAYVDGGILNVFGGSITGNTVNANGKGAGVYQNGTFYLKGNPAFDTADVVYLPSAKIVDAGDAVNRVITKAGDFTFQNNADGLNAIHIELGNSDQNQFSGRNYVESSLDSAVTEADYSGGLFILNNKLEKFDTKFCATDASCPDGPTLEIFKATTLTVTKTWSDGENHDPITIYLTRKSNPAEKHSLVLSDANEWTGTFMDVSDPGSGALDYDLTESDLPGYRSEISEITRVNAQAEVDVWVPVQGNTFSANKSYVLRTGNYVVRSNGQYQARAQSVTIGGAITIEDVRYASYIQGSNITEADVWTTGSLDTNGRTTLKNGSYYLRTTGGSVNGYTTGTPVRMNNSRLEFRYDGDNYRAYVSNGGIRSDDDSNGSMFTLYESKHIDAVDGGYVASITNTKLNDIPKGTHVTANKKIDWLGDSDGNADTSYTGDDMYRLYLDLVSDSTPVDMLLILDVSSSMSRTLDGSYGSSNSRMKIMTDILNGTSGKQGLIYKFLNTNPDNHVAAIKFGGSLANRAISVNDSDEGWYTLADLGGTAADCKVSLTTNSGTNYMMAFYEAYHTFLQTDYLKNSKNKKAIVFITDGAPDSYVDAETGARQPASGDASLDDAATNAANYLRDYYKTQYSTMDFFLVGLSSEASTGSAKTVLENMTAIVDGTYYPTESADDFEDALVTIVDNLRINPVSISDTLSQYVNFAKGAALDFKLTRKDDATGTTTVLWDSSGEKPANTVDGVRIIDKIEWKDKQVIASFNPAAKFDKKYTFTLSFNVKTTPEVFRGNSMSIGDDGTDFGDNATSSGELGYNSNDDAEANFNIGSSAYEVEYDIPVVQSPNKRTDIVYNTRTERWYPTLWDAVNTPDPEGEDTTLEDGDTLIFFGDTAEPDTVVISNDITIRAAKKGSDDEVIAYAEAHVIQDSYAANWKKADGDGCIEVADGAKVVFGGEDSGELTFNARNKGTGIMVEGEAVLDDNFIVANGGIEDEEGEPTGNGGGVFVDDGAVVDLSGATIRDSIAENGGAIYVSDGGTLNVTGGTLEDNVAEKGSGVYQGGTFNLEGGPDFGDNDVYLPSDRTEDSSTGTNRVITKTGDFTFDNMLITLGDDPENQYEGRNYVESGEDAKVVADDLDLFDFTHDLEDELEAVYTGYDKLLEKPVLELMKPKYLTINKVWDDNLTTHPTVTARMRRKATGEVVATCELNSNNEYTSRIKFYGDADDFYVTEDDVQDYVGTVEDIEAVVKPSYWAPADSNTLESGGEYLFLATLRIGQTNRNFLLVQNPNNNYFAVKEVTLSKIDGTNNSISPDSITDRDVWKYIVTTGYNATHYIQNKDSGRYISLDDKDPELSSDRETAQFDNRRIYIDRSRYIKLEWANYASVSVDSDKDAEDATLFIPYICRAGSLSEAEFTVTITNKPGDIDVRKRIDYLGDNGSSVDALDKEKYRLHLDMSLVDEDGNDVTPSKIHDVLSDYVDFVSIDNLVVELRDGDTLKAILWHVENSAAVAETDGSGEKYVSSVLAKDKSVTVTFNKDADFATLASGLSDPRVEVSFMVAPSSDAKNLGKDAYTGTGDTGTDYDSLHPTSAGEDGFPSNDVAEAYFCLSGTTEYVKIYQVPVIQVHDDIVLTIKKSDYEDHSKLLGSATFDLFRVSESDTASAIPYLSGIKGELRETFTTDATTSSVNITVGGGTYYLVEKEAPNGYLTLTKALKIVVTASGVTISSDEDYLDVSDNFTVTVYNEAHSELPATGGAGPKLLYTLGTLLFAGALMAGFIIWHNLRGKEGAN